MNFWKEYKSVQFALLKKMYLHSSTSRHLPQTHTFAPDFKIQYLLSILPFPTFHPNHHVQLVPFSPYILISQPPQLISVSLPISLFFFQPVWVQRTENSKKDRCAHPSWPCTAQAVRNGHHKILLAASLKPEPETCNARSVQHRKL